MNLVEAATVKPLLRGWSHLVTFVAALVSGLVLTTLTDDARLRVGAALFTLASTAMFGISALYHRPHWTPRWRQWMRRLDHAGIFLMIGGTGSAFALALDLPARNQMLLVFGAGAALGILRALVWIHAPKAVVAVLAVALGWMSALFIPQLVDRAGLANVVLLLVGGGIYSLGAGIYALKRPNPWPKVFGYHEIFHALVVLAAVVHFVGVARVCLQVR